VRKSKKGSVISILSFVANFDESNNHKLQNYL